MKTTTLFRPVGPVELKLIKKSGYKEFPPRLPQQPIFYPVMNEAYAIQIARDWNVAASGSGFVTRFEVNSDYLQQFQIQNVGDLIHNELWIPAEELTIFNRHIVGDIIVVKEFYPTVETLPATSETKNINSQRRVLAVGRPKSCSWPAPQKGK